MNRLAVINVVGLSSHLIGKYTPNILHFSEKNFLSSFKPEFPALTCSAQSTYLTGVSPSQHGIVGNGWFDRNDSEVKFWKQSNHLVRSQKVWDSLKEKNPSFTCSQLFWWYNMYANVDYSITPRPIYQADGGKIFDVYSTPSSLRNEVISNLGTFPFPQFWGPFSSIESSLWIANSAQWIEKKYQPTLNLIYLPHLDYCLQKWGPDFSLISDELKKIDELVGNLIQFFESREVQVILLSEYGISPVSCAVHLNRKFRSQGWIQIKDELGTEILDCGASDVFAISDHQIAHIYINSLTLEKKEKVKKFLLSVEGVGEVKDPSLFWGKGIASERAGDLIAIADSESWFSYYYWLEEKKAPDFSRTVDIHRKPGYDPVELFMEENFLKRTAKIGKFFLKKKLGIRGLLDIIPLDDSLVKGSHGRDKVEEKYQPIFVSSDYQKEVKNPRDIATIIKSLVKD